MRVFALRTLGSRCLSTGFRETIRGVAKFSAVTEAREDHALPFANSREEDSYDVVIVGGGMVGAAMGCGLASSSLTNSLRVAIVDGDPATKNIYTRAKDAVPDCRVSTLTPATVQYLKDVGAWDAVSAQHPTAFDSMQVWDYSGKGFTRYRAADVNEDVLGYVVENDVIKSALISTFQRSDHAEVICPARVEEVILPAKPSTSTGFKGLDMLRDSVTSRLTDLEQPPAQPPRSISLSQNDDRAQVFLNDGRTLKSRLVVGADGSRSRVRAMAGLKTTGWNYNQSALICTVEVATPDTTAWQRFLPTGPLALLPVGERYDNIVWSTTPEKAKEMKALSEDDFVLAVNKALREDYAGPPSSQLGYGVAGRWLSPLLGGLPPSAEDLFHVPPRVTKCVSPRFAFPLSLKHATKYVSPRLALVGDAAHTVHPLAGQGVNLGFGDAEALVKILGEGVKSGSEIGELSLLEQYEEERLWANIPMMAVLDGFQRVFSADILPINLARAAGFSAANYIGPLKKQIISYAMGFKS